MPDESRRACASITIRDAHVEDAPAMGRFMVTTWLRAHRRHIPLAAWQRRKETWTPEVSAAGWERHLRDRDEQSNSVRTCYLIAEDAQNTIIGLVAAAVADDDPTGASGEVGSLYVHPSYQRRGIGRLLVRRVASRLHALGVETLQIGVVTANIDACRFYERLGGQILGERLFDEDGDLLPERIYIWPDIITLLSSGRPGR